MVNAPFFGTAGRISAPASLPSLFGWAFRRSSGGAAAPEKNLFIVTVPLASRAAIQGGMQVDDAFTLSDSYIRQCELLSSPERIVNLQYRMLLDYAERVERLHRGKASSKLAADAANYVQHHLSDAIKTEDITGTLYMSRPYLSKKFKEDTGGKIADFILKEKTEEAKRLLRYSDKSLTVIGSYLGFSLSSHFSRIQDIRRLRSFLVLFYLRRVHVVGSIRMSMGYSSSRPNSISSVSTTLASGENAA